MDPTYKFPGSPGTPLYQVSPERVNQQRGRNGQELPSSPIVGALKSSSYRENHSRESSVHEKVAAFNSLAVSQTDKKIMEQGAQLKRAMVGREEAVRARGDAEQQRDQARSELRKYEAETKKLNKQVELLLKKLDEGKGRELIVCQKLETRQEELGQAKEKYAHTKAEWEKEVRRLRKESFKSQSMMVKIQEELKAARMDLRIQSLDFEAEKERSRVREQEAFEARYQLVGVQEELAQMMEKVKLVEQERDALRTIAKNEEIARIAAEGQLPLPRLPENDEFASPKKARRSLDPVTVLSSAASEEELEDIKLLLQWEKHNAARAHDRVEFLEMECRMNCQTSRASRATSPEQVVTGRATPVEEDTVIYSPRKPEEEEEEEAKQSHIFIPAEEIFRAVPSPTEESPWISPAKKTVLQPSPAFTELDGVEEPPRHARTPSCEPPAPAVIQDASITALINSSMNASTRASLQSLLDAPHSPSHPSRPSYNSSDDNDNTASFDSEDTTTTINLTENIATTLVPTFHTISTTTRIPLKMEVTEKKPSIAPITVLKPGDRTFDPAILSPTMTREEALAQIQARRGRARSIAQGTLTPRKQMVEGGVRRDISAPAFRSGGTVRGRSQARAAAL